MYLCEDVATDGDDITFSWQLSGNVFASAGFIAFKVLAAKTDGENVQTRWNTVPAIGTVLMTVPDGMDIGEAYPDIVTQLLERMASVEKIATEEAMQGYVNTYLEAHPGEIDETLTDPKKAAPASVVGELKEDLNDITETKFGVNKISASALVNGYYIDDTNGGVCTNENWIYSPDYYEIEPNTEYIFVGITTESGAVYRVIGGYDIAFYNANKTYTLGKYTTLAESVISDANSKYVRVSFENWYINQHLMMIKKSDKSKIIGKDASVYEEP